MKEKFKPGDKIINQHGVIWIVTKIKSEYMTGIVLQHSDRRMIGMMDTVWDSSTITWSLLDKRIFLEAPPGFAIGDLVEDRYNHTVEMIVIGVQETGVTCVDLITSLECVYDPEDLRNSEGVCISNNKQYHD